MRRLLKPLRPKTERLYRSLLDRAWPGASYSAGLNASGPLPTYVPPEVLGWPESVKALLRAALHRIFLAAGRSFAEADEFVAQIPMTAVQKKAKYPLPDSAIDAYEATAALEQPRDRALALLLPRGGFRADELLSLRRVDVERAVNAGKDGMLKFVRKGGDEQALPSWGMNDLLRILLDTPAAQPHVIVERAKIREPWHVLGEVLAGKHASEKTRYNLLNRLVHRLWATAAPGLGYTPHKLRHAFATRMMRAGAPVRVIQEALGHKSIVTTERYLHVSAEDLKKWMGPKREQ